MTRMLAIGIAALGVAACGRGGSHVDYHADGSETVTVKDRGGTTVAKIGATATMPAGLPAWTPAYPGSTMLVAQAHDGAGTGGKVENVMLHTPDAMAKVSAFYDGRIAAAGLKPMHAAGSADVSIRLVETPSGMVSVNVAKDEDGGSLISISRMPKG